MAREAAAPALSDVTPSELGQHVEDDLDSESDVLPGLRASVAHWGSLIGQHWDAGRDGRAPRPARLGQTARDMAVELARSRRIGTAPEEASTSESEMSWMWANGDESVREVDTLSGGSASPSELRLTVQPEVGAAAGGELRVSTEVASCEVGHGSAHGADEGHLGSAVEAAGSAWVSESIGPSAALEGVVPSPDAVLASDAAGDGALECTYAPFDDDVI